MSLEKQKLHMEEQARNLAGKSFLKRNRVLIAGAIGFVVVHIGWYRLVEMYVPEEEKPTYYYIYNLMRQLDPSRKNELKK